MVMVPLTPFADEASTTLNVSGKKAWLATIVMFPPVPAKALARISLFWRITKSGSIMMLPPIVVVLSLLPTDEVMWLSIALNIPLALTMIFPPSASDAVVFRMLFVVIAKVLPASIAISPAFPSPVLALDRVAPPCSVTLFALSVMLPALRVPWVSALTLPPAMVSVGAVRVILGRGSPGRSTPLVTLAEILGFVRVMAFASTVMLPPRAVLFALVSSELFDRVTESAGEASP